MATYDYDRTYCPPGCISQHASNSFDLGNESDSTISGTYTTTTSASTALTTRAIGQSYAKFVDTAFAGDYTEYAVGRYVTTPYTSPYVWPVTQTFDKDYVKKMIKMIDDLALAKNSTNKENETMDLKREIKKLTKGEDAVLLEEYGVVDECGDVTSRGKELIWDKLLEAHKADIVADLKKLDAKKKKKKDK